MASLDKYLPRIRPHVKGCPDVAIKDALLITLRDICYRTNIWPYSTSLYLVDGIEEYELDSLPNTEVATVQAIIRPDKTRLQGRDILPPYASKGTPRYFRHYERGTITVSPIPSKNVLHSAELTLMPTLSATEVPDSLYADTAEFAPWGVLAQLQMIEQEDWHNPQSGRIQPPAL